MTLRSLAVLTLVLTPLALAAQEADPAQPAGNAPAQTEAVVAVAPERQSMEPKDTVVQDFARLMRAHPVELSTVVALEPSLLTNAEFLARYPELQRFLQQNPELGLNPRLYTERAYLRRAQSSQAQLVDGIFENLAIFATSTIFLLSALWLIRTLIEQRRWSRLAKVQAEVHGKLMDRLQNNQELLSYIQSSAGRRFLESAPIPVSAEVRGPAFSGGRMMWSLQIGIILTAGSLGLLLVSRSFTDAAAEVFALGVIGLCVGLGFAASGIVSSVVSRRLGLWESDVPGNTGTE